MEAQLRLARDHVPFHVTVNMATPEGWFKFAFCFGHSPFPVRYISRVSFAWYV